MDQIVTSLFTLIAKEWPLVALTALVSVQIIRERRWYLLYQNNLHPEQSANDISVTKVAVDRSAQDVHDVHGVVMARDNRGTPLVWSGKVDILEELEELRADIRQGFDLHREALQGLNVSMAERHDQTTRSLANAMILLDKLENAIRKG